MAFFTVSQSDEGKRLDVFLSHVLDIPRTKIQKAIKNGTIKLNDQVEKPHTKIKTGDNIEHPNDLSESTVIEKEQTPDLNIIAETNDYLVINKPAGLLVHETESNKVAATLVDAIIKQYPDIKNIGDDETRPGIVHRLDKDVSGLMIIPKNQKTFDFIKSQFQNRTIKKEYLALVYGSVLKDIGEIDLKIARSKSQGKMVARTKEQEGKDAVTKFEIINRFKTATYLKLFPLTGRTHQIRVHMKAIDHPVVGDKLYAKRNMKNIRPIEMNRIFLHAFRLTIPFHDGEKTFEAQLPKELEEILDTLPKQ